MSDVSYQEFVIEGATTIIEGVGWVVPEGATYNEIVILAAAAIITSGGVSDSGIAALILNEASVTRQALNATYAPRAAALLARLAAPSTNPLPDAMAVPPTIDHGGSPAGARQFFSAAGFGRDGHVGLLGPRGTYDTVNGRLAVGGLFSGIDTWCDALNFRIGSQAQSTQGVYVWVWIDGAPATATPDFISTTAGQSVPTNIVFASAKRRRITVYAAGIVGWTAATIPVTGSLSEAAPLPRIALIGDSFFGGSAPSPILQASGVTIARQLGMNPLIAAIGGTGYLAGSETFGSSARVSTVAAFDPELIVMSGSVTDPPSGLEEAAAAAFAAYGVACPGVPIVCFSPQPSNATDTAGSGRAAAIAAVKAAADAAPNVIAFFDMVGTHAGSAPPAWAAYVVRNTGDLVSRLGSVYEWCGANAEDNGPLEPTTNTRWRLKTWMYTGTGQVSAAAGDGSRDLLLGASGDSVHPSIAGSNGLAAIQAASVRSALTAISNP